MTLGVSVAGWFSRQLLPRKHPTKVWQAPDRAYVSANARFSTAPDARGVMPKRNDE